MRSCFKIKISLDYTFSYFMKIKSFSKHLTILILKKKIKKKQVITKYKKGSALFTSDSFLYHYYEL